MIKPSFLFTDNAVLQRDKEIRVFGECDSVTLTVEFANVSAAAMVEDGRFLAILPPMEGNICSDLVFRSESETVTLKNVVTGDVWLCSGQSNMEHPTFCTCYGEDTVAADDGIRLFTVPRRMYENAQEWGWHFYPTFSADTPWKLFEREAALRFSAVGVFFAKEIRKEINVPIGLISCDQGASNMEAWIDRDALLGNEITRYAVDVFDKRFKDIDMTEYHRNFIENYRKKVLAYIEEGNDIFKTAEEKGVDYALRHGFNHQIAEGPYHYKAPGRCWNHMLKRVQPLSISGVLWYQGESNAGATPFGIKASFKALMGMLVSEWREAFNDENLQFYTVQLAAYPCGNETGRAWAEVREAQKEFADENENVYMVTALDTGENDNIHPADKYPVGARLAAAAMANHYGLEVSWRSPELKSAVKSGDTVTLEFKNVRELLCVLSKPTSFYVEDKDGAERETGAVIEGNRVIIKSADAVAVSYCYRNFAVASVIDADSALPLLPFYTKLKTED